MGGLVTALGCLFTSFAFHFHQLIVSHGLVVGIGVGMVRDTATLMLGQYFKRRREQVEILLVSASGFGLAAMSFTLREIVREIRWRLGLQAVTVLLASSFILGMFYRSAIIIIIILITIIFTPGMFYRSASLYHPQRRAILHLKNQKRKIKDKNRSQEDKPPFFDISCLKSRTIQILLVSTALGAFGLNTPLIYLAVQAEHENISEGKLLQLQVYLGLAWALGCCIFGCLVLQRSGECRVGRQYLCQVSLLVCGLSLLSLTTVEGFNGYVTFTWVYGLFLGGYNYSLKMYVYQKVRARNFPRAWGYIQAVQALPLLVGPPLSCQLSLIGGAGYFVSACAVLLASLTLFLVNAHKSRLRRRQRARRHAHNLDLASGLLAPDHLGELGTKLGAKEEERRVSLTYTDYFPVPPPHMLTSHNSLDQILDFKKPELTCISEEGIADMDLPDNLLDELELMDGITSCNKVMSSTITATTIITIIHLIIMIKVENYLMLSEYEQNLLKETEGPVGLIGGRRGRR